MENRLKDKVEVRWHRLHLADAARLDYERGGPEVSVIVNGHRYNIT